MSAVVDTSVLVDVLRGSEPAAEVLTERRRAGALQSSLVVQAEVLAGMRASEEEATHVLLASLDWHHVDERIAAEAGKLGRQWLPSHNGIDVADLLIAATANVLGLPVLTRNVRHFPMFTGLRPPY